MEARRASEKGTKLLLLAEGVCRAHGAPLWCEYYRRVCKPPAASDAHCFNPDDRLVFYPYFTDTLLDLMRADPDFPPTELKKVLRYVGEAIQEFHGKGWLHLGALYLYNQEI